MTLSRNFPIGLEFPYVPESHGVPLVCDMSSNIATKRIDVSKVWRHSLSFFDFENSILKSMYYSSA